MERTQELAVKILSQLSLLFDEDNDNYIDLEELAKEKSGLTDFIHALANIAPNMMYQQITGKNANNLEFNHIANQLVFQYSNQIDEDTE